MESTPAEMWDKLIASALAQKKPSNTERKRSGLIPLRLQATSKRVEPTIIDRSVAEIADGIRATFRELISGHNPWPLLMHGQAGTGKTCALLCLLDYAGGEYHTVSGLCSLMNRAALGRVEWYREGRGGTLWPEMIWERIAKQPLIVLDEIGCRSNVSDAHYEVVKEMIDIRQRKPFAVISNLAPDILGKLYDDRILSRLSSGTVIELAGPDRRLE